MTHIYMIFIVKKDLLKRGVFLLNLNRPVTFGDYLIRTIELGNSTYHS